MPIDLDFFDDEPERLKGGFVYPGCKYRSLNEILPHLPQYAKYVEPFAGTGSVLLNRKRSKLEVFNDIDSAIVNFYWCLRECPAELHEFISLIPAARAEFKAPISSQRFAKPVEKAARWYFNIQLSFGGMGRNFATTDSTHAQRHITKMHTFGAIRERLKGVYIENKDYLDCLQKYDSDDTVFYCDPPYLDIGSGGYKNPMRTIPEHTRFLDAVFDCKGFVAVSGYIHPLYERYAWDHRYSWHTYVPISKGTRGNATEALYIKEAE